MAKIGRNDPCPCGSGKKYKKCHLNMQPVSKQYFTSERAQQLQLMEAKEYQRKKQQGLGREIISADFKGQKFVAVGSELHHSPNWKTFPDFLDYYIKHVLGMGWSKAEFSKKFPDKHPIYQWYDIWLQNRIKEPTSTPGVFANSPMGASTSFYGLAYNLYLIRHNAGIQKELIRRLKLADRSNFHGALYETCVASYFIRAGYDLEFENELDGTKTHCEFTATNKKTGRKFSVEAKTLAFAKKGKPKVISKLNSALHKEASHERVVFIDIGRPSKTFSDSEKWMLSSRERLNELETSHYLNGQNLPAAYVIFTNHPFWNALKSSEFHFSAMCEGFKIPTIKAGYKDTIRNALIERERHREIFDLIESIESHGGIPSTFDGENPEIRFGDLDENPRLIIGEKYIIPSDKGDEIGILVQAVVRESEKQVFGLYEVEGGRTKIVTCPISDTELAAYKKHPETFFGKVEPHGQIKSPLDMYDWIYDCYKNSSKETLLNLMKGAPNYDDLKLLPQAELARLYSEHATEWAVSKPL